MQETHIWSLGWEDPLEEYMATHSTILAWKSCGQRNLVGYSPWGCKELYNTEHACIMPYMVYYVWFQQTLRIILKARNKHPSFEDKGSWDTKKLHKFPKQTFSVSGEPEFEPLSVGLHSPCFFHYITLHLSKPLIYFIHSKNYSTIDSIQYARIWIDKNLESIYSFNISLNILSFTGTS